VKTASDIVPMMNPFELRSFSMNGGFEPCCVNDSSQFGRAMKDEVLCFSPRLLSRLHTDAKR